MAAVLEIIKRITGFIVGVLIGCASILIGCAMERWAYKKIWNLKKPSRVEEISYQIPAMGDCAASCIPVSGCG